MPNIGPLEIAIVALIVLVIFGPKRLPELGRGLGKGMREFKDSITGKDEERKELKASADAQTSGQAAAPPEQAAATAPAPPQAPETQAEGEREPAGSSEPRG
jgi:sec-independent protein translocase protein TatA